MTDAVTFYTHNDLLTAYRRAKVDLFYTTQPRLRALVHYEEHLDERLSTLLELIDGEDESWVESDDFVGGVTVLPKRIKPVDRPVQQSVISDPWSAWTAVTTAALPDRPTAEFRLMSTCSIDLHVLSTLWLFTVGGRMEARLLPAATGSRLRRRSATEVNRVAPTSFHDYRTHYRRWREDGISAMTTALDDGRPIVALTADATSFYHRLDAGFLLESDFVERVLGLEDLTDDERKINRLFVRALQAWARRARRSRSTKGADSRGLPVGLPASAVVANLALAELDQLAVEEFKPLYYGRYVDDLLVVLDKDDNLTDQSAVWEWLGRRSRGLLGPAEPDSTRSFAVRFAPAYLADSEVVFGNEKNRTFQLSGTTGRFLLESIKRTIADRTSEWRALPAIPEDVAQIQDDVAVAIRKDGDRAESLRETDQVSSRRSGFAIRLRNLETYERNLPPGEWASQRTAFFDTVCEQVLCLPMYFDLAGYVPRLVKLAAACGDIAALEKLLGTLVKLADEVERTCTMTVKDHPRFPQKRLIQTWRRQLRSELWESLASGWRMPSSSPEIAGVVDLLNRLAPASNAEPMAPGAVERWQKRFFARDLAHVPYRFCVLGIGIGSTVPYDEASIGRLDEELDSELATAADELVERTRHRSGRAEEDRVQGSRNAGIVLGTRPPSVMELYLGLRDPGATSNYGLPSGGAIATILRGLRGYLLRGKLPDARVEHPGGPTVISIAQNGPGDGPEGNRGRRRIALTVAKTADLSLRKSLNQCGDLSYARFSQFSRLLNRVDDADYLLLPEISMPERWFLPFAIMLQSRNVDLISGIEYRHQAPDVVHNQVWAALRIDGLGFPAAIVYPQDKQCPAPHERRMLQDVAHLRLVPEVTWPDGRPPVIAHGEFRFSMLICSELTNIAHRSTLRGEIDALLVPEWNKDLHTFEALVESAALDVHCYVAQSNDRKYGDSRIRAPMAKEHRRDLLRLRGGDHDYVVTATIDFHSLREHQSAKYVEDSDFKPLPDGFEIAQKRKRPPAVKL